MEASTESRSRRASALASALDPIASFLRDPAVVEIMLNADGVVWVERIGDGMLRTDACMQAVQADRMLRLIASEIGVELHASSPSLSAKLPPPWGARLQASIPPIVDAPTFALRKPPSVLFSLDDYLRARILTESQRDALTEAIREHANILVGGGTGSGKTKLANALLKKVSEIGTDLSWPNTRSTVTRPSNSGSATTSPALGGSTARATGASPRSAQRDQFRRLGRAILDDHRVNAFTHRLEREPNREAHL